MKKKQTCSEFCAKIIFKLKLLYLDKLLTNYKGGKMLFSDKHTYIHIHTSKAMAVKWLPFTLTYFQFKKKFRIGDLFT